MGKITLRRYTNLAATIHVLQSRSITLLNPIFWDDRNDAYFMNSYRERKGAKTVLALCFAEAFETYQHWKVFSHGADGICIEFDKDKLLTAFEGDDRIKTDSVKYEKISDMKNVAVKDDELPFLKRYPYQDEKEFRIVYTDSEEIVDSKSFTIELNALGRIYLSPWMPIPLSKSVVTTLRSIRGWSHLKVFRSTLIENEKWKTIAGRKDSVS
jgi:hypothetical protein